MDFLDGSIKSGTVSVSSRASSDVMLGVEGVPSGAGANVRMDKCTMVEFGAGFRLSAARYSGARAPPSAPRPDLAGR